MYLYTLGVTQLVNYHKEVKRLYKPQKLGLAFPRLYDVSHAENIASAFLQVKLSTAAMLVKQIISQFLL
jgi:hypothetical protein